MTIRLAHKTLEAITSAIEADQGASFRVWQGRVISHFGDAFRGGDSPFREHLGASVAGTDCARAIWYDFHWCIKPQFDARTLRLFNRGHLEEARFTAMLLMIGCKVYQQDANGKQYRIHFAGGHAGGSGDGVVQGLPDLRPDQFALIECKTHGDDSFKKLLKYGVKESKKEHFIQMNIYMYKMGLAVALYMAVNKNTDELYLELVEVDTVTAEYYINRATKIVWADKAPPKYSKSVSLPPCAWCKNKKICHFEGAVEMNCRTCAYSEPHPDKKAWVCKKHIKDLDFEAQLVGCDSYERNKEI